MERLRVPKGWVITDIENILSAQSDGKFIHQGWSPQCDKEPAKSDEWGVLKTTAIQDGFFVEEENKRLPKTKEPKPRIEVKSGDLLVTNAGPRARCGVICFVKDVRQRLMISGKMYRLRFPEKLIHPQYIEAWLRTSFAQKELNNRKTGISESGLNMTQAKFKTLPMLIAPYDEQKVIAEKLDTLLAQVETTKARLESTLETLKRFRQSVLASAVSGKLTEVYDFKTEPLDKLIEEMRNGLSPKPNEDGLGYPILRISSVRAMEVDTSDVRYLECDKSTKERYALKEDDLLFTRYNGSLDFVGVCGLFKDCKHETLLYPDKLIRVRTNTSKLLPKFAEIYFSSPEIRTLVTNFVKSTSGQKGISGKDLKSVAVKYPTTDEQIKIIDIVEKLFGGADATEQQVNQALERVNNLTQSILAKAFRGELTEQWRKDNPDLISGENSAEALLKKIKAERAAAKPKRKTKK